MNFFLLFFLAILELSDQKFTSMYKIQQKIGKMRSMFKNLHMVTAQLDASDSKFVKNALGKILLAERLDSNFENPMSIYSIAAYSWDIAQVLRKQEPADFCFQHLGVNGTLLDAYMFDIDDVRGCLRALVELQWVYKLHARQVSMGYFGKGVPRSAPLNASQCELMTLWSNYRGFYHQEEEWLVETLRRTAPFYHLGKPLRLFDFFYSERYQEWYFEKLVAIALRDSHTDLAKSLMASMTHIYGYHRYSALANQMRVVRNGGIFKYCDKSIVKVEARKNGDVYGGDVWDIFEQRRLCTKAHYRPEGYCRYAAPNSFYKIGPIREEVYSNSPFIRVWHKIVHPRELAYIKRMTAKELQRATVIDENDHSKALFSDIRTSENMFISHKIDARIDEILRRIDSRIDALAGTYLEEDYKNSEEYQVGNYGIGGFYASHTDYVERPGKWYDIPTGQPTNRYATAMIYASDVKVGGGTMFPDLDITVLPREGSMVFWYNMLRHGEVDPRTRHCGCPVLSGSKWVVNKWIQYHGHHVNRPCKLEKTNE